MLPRKDQNMMKNPMIRWTLMAALLTLVVAALAAGRSTLAASHTRLSQNREAAFTFNLIPSLGIATNCLPHASGSASIFKNAQNDTLTIHVTGLAPSTGYDLFVIETPNSPFGVSWYQSDLETNDNGEGSVEVVGIFNVETFSISTGAGPSGVVFNKAVHQYHLGLWFNDPQVPFKLGCELGLSEPKVTPFNGEQHAGIQVLNTANFPIKAGPLSHVSA
jgi:hypothetical protein